MDAKAFAQWAILALTAIIAIAVGIFIAPWLGAASLYLAALLSLTALIGILYAGEGIPWIDRVPSISRLLQIYAPPLTEEEKLEIARHNEPKEDEDPFALSPQTSATAALAHDLATFTTKKQPDQPAQQQSPPQASEPATSVPTLDDLIGLASVKDAIRECRATFEYAKARGDTSDRNPPRLNFVFTGNPGTGKTTVARILGRIFLELGYLKTDKIVEVKRENLIGSYQAETEQKTLAALESAIGATFFLDEAHNLTPETHGHYTDVGQHVVTTLLPFVEDNRGKMLVILAGYEDKMRTLINSDDGLLSRFNRYIHFPDYSWDEALEIFLRTLTQDRYTLTQDATEILPSLFVKLHDAPKWANARDVRNFFETTRDTKALRYQKDPKESELYSLNAEDLENALEKILEPKLRIGAGPDDLDSA